VIVPSCYLSAEGPSALEVLSCGTWCGGDLSVTVGVEEMLSLRRLLPESLAESEAVGEARPSRSGQDQWASPVL
jgi:hypothetical protein